MSFIQSSVTEHQSKAKPSSVMKLMQAWWGSPDTWTVESLCGRSSLCIRIHVHPCTELWSSLETHRRAHVTPVPEKYWPFLSFVFIKHMQNNSWLTQRARQYTHTPAEQKKQCNEQKMFSSSSPAVLGTTSAFSYSSGRELKVSEWETPQCKITTLWNKYLFYCCYICLSI